MPDTQYWKEMDKASHYPPAQKAVAEKTALTAYNKRKRAQKQAKPKKPSIKKPPKKKKNGAKKIRKARKVTKKVMSIFR